MTSQKDILFEEWLKVNDHTINWECDFPVDILEKAFNGGFEAKQRLEWREIHNRQNYAGYDDDGL